MVIERKEYARVINRYRLEIDEEYIKKFNEDLKKKFIDFNYEVTEKDFRNIMNGDIDVDENIEIKYKCGGTYYRGDNLYDVILDWIDSDLRDSYYDEYDRDIDEVDDEVID